MKIRFEIFIRTCTLVRNFIKKRGNKNIGIRSKIFLGTELFQNCTNPIYFSLNILHKNVH